jgi:hypothetical protein
MRSQIPAVAAVALLVVVDGAAGWDVPNPPRLPLSQVPAVCERIAPPPASRHVLRTGSGGAWPAYVVETSGGNYEVGVRRAQVHYVQTADKRFRTPENLRVGSSLADVRRVVREDVTYDPGWAYWVRLPSGWSAALSPDKKPGDHAKIRWFFMRGDCNEAGPAPAR